MTTAARNMISMTGIKIVSSKKILLPMNRLYKRILNHMTCFCHMRGVKYKTPDLLSSKFFVKDVIKEARIYREI